MLTNILIVEEGGIPNFKHNCLNCIFLGAAKNGKETVDLYACKREGDELHLIVRDGDEEEQYATMPESSASIIVIYSQILKLYKDHIERKQNQLVSIDNLKIILLRCGIENPSDNTLAFAKAILLNQNG
jgi:hypothetical protein